MGGGALPPWVQTMDLLPLVQKMQYRTYAKEEFILREGEFSSEMYFLLKGKVKVSKGDTFLAMLNEGSFFGEMGAVAKGPRTASVQAQTPVHAFVLLGSDVQQMMAVSPEAGQKLVGEATARLEELLIQSQAKKEEESKAVEQGEGKKGEGKKDKSEKDDKSSPGTTSGAGGGPQVEYMVAKPGEVVISEGELTDDFYFLRSGEVEVSKEGRVVATLRGGVLLRGNGCTLSGAPDVAGNVPDVLRDVQDARGGPQGRLSRGAYLAEHHRRDPLHHRQRSRAGYARRPRLRRPRAGYPAAAPRPGGQRDGTQPPHRHLAAPQSRPRGVTPRKALPSRA